MPSQAWHQGPMGKGGCRTRRGWPSVHPHLGKQAAWQGWEGGRWPCWSSAWLSRIQARWWMHSPGTGDRALGLRKVWSSRGQGPLGKAAAARPLTQTLPLGYLPCVSETPGGLPAPQGPPPQSPRHRPRQPRPVHSRQRRRPSGRWGCAGCTRGSRLPHAAASAGTAMHLSWGRSVGPGPSRRRPRSRPPPTAERTAAGQEGARGRGGGPAGGGAGARPHSGAGARGGRRGARGLTGRARRRAQRAARGRAAAGWGAAWWRRRGRSRAPGGRALIAGMTAHSAESADRTVCTRRVTRAAAGVRGAGPGRGHPGRPPRGAAHAARGRARRPASSRSAAARGARGRGGGGRGPGPPGTGLGTLGTGSRTGPEPAAPWPPQARGLCAARGQAAPPSQPRPLRCTCCSAGLRPGLLFHLRLPLFFDPASCRPHPVSKCS